MVNVILFAKWFTAPPTFTMLVSIQEGNVFLGILATIALFLGAVVLSVSYKEVFVGSPTRFFVSKSLVSVLRAISSFKLTYLFVVLAAVFELVLALVLSMFVFVTGNVSPDGFSGTFLVFLVILSGGLSEFVAVCLTITALGFQKGV